MDIIIKGLDYEQMRKFRNAISYGYFNAYELNPREWRHTFVGAFIWKYPGRVKLMNTIRQIVGHVPTWEDMDETTLKDLVEELKEQGLAPSSIYTMCSELKAVLNSNYKRIPCSREDLTQILSVKKNASQAIYLTREEMQLIVDYKPVGELQHYVQRNFVVEMLTGARRVDAERLTLNNCDPNSGILSYIPQKTPNIIVRVPIDERMGLRRFLVNTTRRETCADVFNETLRIICRNCGINDMTTVTRANKTITTEKWKLISSHTGRRSFATNLFLAGVSLEDIAMMMGHGKNIETTKRYICAERAATPAVIAYFQQVDADKQSEQYKKAYNDAIDDVFEILDTTAMLDKDGIIYREIHALKK